MLLLGSTMAKSKLLVGSRVVRSILMLVGSKVVQGQMSIWSSASLLREGDRSVLTVVLVPSLIRDKAEVVL